MLNWALTAFAHGSLLASVSARPEHRLTHTHLKAATGDLGSHGASSSATRECKVSASMQGISTALVKASEKCSKDAHITVEAGDSLIDHVVVLEALSNVQFTILGNLHLKDDWDMWQRTGYMGVPDDNKTIAAITFANSSNLHIEGPGQIDGHGASAWKLGKASTVLRPLLILFQHVTTGSYSKMRHIDSPAANLYIYGSQDIRVSEFQLDISDNGPGSALEARNTDAVLVRESSNIEIFDSRVYNVGEVVSLKEGSSNIHVHDVIGGYRCDGISVGPLGNRIDRPQNVKDIVFENIELQDCEHGAQIRAFSGHDSDPASVLGGGGTGLAQNITFKNFNLKDVGQAIAVDQCYDVEKPNEDCFGAPTKVVFKDVSFSNLVGTVKVREPWKYDYASNFACSAGPTSCINLRTSGLTLASSYNHSKIPSHCSGVSFDALKDVLCDYPINTKRRNNGTVQLQTSPGVFGPLINHPTLPKGYTSCIPAPGGLWAPKYETAAKVSYFPIHQPIWPDSWSLSPNQTISRPPTGDALPKPMKWSIDHPDLIAPCLTCKNGVTMLGDGTPYPDDLAYGVPVGYQGPTNTTCPKS